MRCALCKVEMADDNRPEEERVREMKSNFGEYTTVEDCEVVCDRCYQNIINELKRST